MHPAYANPRPEVTAVIPKRLVNVLDVGCSTGAMGGVLRQVGHTVTGIEIDEGLAARARENLDNVIVGDIEKMASDAALVGAFDCVVFADVLEHLRDPWSVVRWGVEQLAPSGAVVVSVPNIRHAKTFWTLAVRRHWPYEDVGIFDRTHLRFFARRNLAELLEGTNFEITELRPHRMLRLDPSSWLNRIAPFVGDLGTLQFVFRAEARR